MVVLALLGFLANPKLSTNLIVLPTMVLVGLAMLFLSAWWVVENFYWT